MNHLEESVFVVMTAGSFWPMARSAEEPSKPPAGRDGTAWPAWLLLLGLILAYGTYATWLLFSP